MGGIAERPAAGIKLDAVGRTGGRRIVKASRQGIEVAHDFRRVSQSGSWHGLPLRAGAGSRTLLALEIAKAHGGTIGVFSDETGTCFTFKMPTGRSKL